MKSRAILTAALVLFSALPCLACGIKGDVKRSDGSKVDKSATITTNWNGKKAYPRNGSYSLDLGSSACGKNVEVFANGYSVGTYTIPSNGFAVVDITLKGSSDVPVR